ncbi:MAG TPA: hypothetical protein VHD61_02210 [Lacunisphaera sp.]|nr:hypothetical protein [Lacunisphaera sp.]
MDETSIYIPPFANVRLIECRDYIALTPVPSFREFFGIGKKKAREVRVDPDDPKSELLWDDCSEDEEVWVAVQWIRFEDGHEEQGSITHLRRATEDDAKAAMERMRKFYSMTKEDLIALSKCFKATDDDLAYIEYRYPNYQSPPTGPGMIEERDLYSARLKVLAGLHPRTVALIKQADETKDPVQKEKLGREAVAAYFAELAHHWTEDEVLEWQRSNPVGTEWLCEFGRVFQEPEKEIDPINFELAFNWLRKKYNLLTAEELSDAILVRTGQRLMPGTLKKRRERLGLTSDRDPGPRPRDSQ